MRKLETRFMAFQAIFEVFLRHFSIIIGNLGSKGSKCVRLPLFGSYIIWYSVRYGTPRTPLTCELSK